MLEIDFTEQIEALNNKIGGVKLSASRILALYEELEWLSLEQLKRLVETLKYEEKFPTLARIYQTLGNMGITKNGIKQDVYSFNCENCGAEFCVRLKDLNYNNTISCPNTFYDKCNKIYSVVDLNRIINNNKNK